MAAIEPPPPDESMRAEKRDAVVGSPGPGQWLLFLLVAAWLAGVPLLVAALASAWFGAPPEILVQLELAAPVEPALPAWLLGLLATGLSLGLQLALFGPLYYLSRRSDREFMRTTALLAGAIALFQALNALAALPAQGQESISPAQWPTTVAVLRLVLALPFLLLGLGWLEGRRGGERSLLRALRWAGLRMWSASGSMWLALGSGALIVWPWVLVGSLGSTGTTAATFVQALPNALGEEILFRGFALAWLWRASQRRTGAAIASLILFVAAQGGTVLPAGDWGALLHFAAALCLGLLLTELTVRAGGSIWPAVVVHLIYDWFHLAFVDPRSQEEMLHWLVQVWAPLTAGGLGLVLWLGRKLLPWLSSPRRPEAGERRAGAIAAAGLAAMAWIVVVVLYFSLGTPGFHPDGFVIYMREQADLTPAAAIDDPVARREWVYRRLVETAESSQAPLRAELESRGVTYRTHYLINLIEVQERPGLRRAFARRAGVAAVMFQPGVRPYPRSFELPDLDASGPSGAEWNVRKVGADRVWDAGYTGRGIVVGDVDTGVAWEHPALKNAYLGWDGQQAVHDYHWFDAWDGRAAPWDDNGHGTHTTGIMVGLDGENKVGLAPGARWIACRNMRHGLGNPGSYLTCLEFMLAPFPLTGDALQDGDPARGAHVVNNSWGCPTFEGCRPDTLRLALRNLRAAGLMMVVSAGNDGPLCSSVKDVPATYDAAFSVGATDRTDRAAGFSSRGPVVVDGSQRLKPDIVAPGVDVRSAVPDGYASLPGTSMAGPHVAAAVALLWSAEPSLRGDIDCTETLLTRTARPHTVDAVCERDSHDVTTVCACGDDRVESVPNNVYGWGLLDVWAAVQEVLGGSGGSLCPSR